VARRDAGRSTVNIGEEMCVLSLLHRFP